MPALSLPPRLTGTNLRYACKHWDWTIGTTDERLSSEGLILSSLRLSNERERSLRRREYELAEILENAVEGVQQVGADQRILWANKALLKLLGYSAEEYVNRQLSDFHLDEQ